MPRSGLLARFALLVATSALLAGFAELGLRLLGVGEIMVYRTDPRFGYLMLPSQVISTYGEELRINALGLRGAEVVEPAPLGVHRLLFLGDSITYGGGRIAESRLFCRQVEALARRDGLALEAINVSAPGWSPQNWGAWVRANGFLDSDVVVPVLPAIDRSRPFATLGAGSLVDRKPLLRLFALAMRVRAQFATAPPHDDAAHAANVAALREVLELAAGRAVLGVLVPSRLADTKPEEWRPFEALLPDAVDLRGVLSDDDYLDVVHLGESGHRVAAERIYPRVRALVAALPRAH